MIMRRENGWRRERGDQKVHSGFLDKTLLLRLKLRAMQAGVWFRALPQIDRALLEVTLKVNADIRSRTLLKSIAAIARKLESFLGGKLHQAVEEIGSPLACKFSSLAKKMGQCCCGTLGLR